MPRGKAPEVGTRHKGAPHVEGRGRCLCNKAVEYLEASSLVTSVWAATSIIEYTSILDVKGGQGIGLRNVNVFLVRSFLEISLEYKYNLQTHAFSQG